MVPLDKYITLIQIYMQGETCDHRFYILFRKSQKNKVPNTSSFLEHTTLNKVPFGSGSSHSTPPPFLPFIYQIKRQTMNNIEKPIFLSYTSNF